MKFKEFCEKIKGANLTVYELLPEHSKRQWKEEFNLINKADQLSHNAKTSLIVLDASYKAPSKSTRSNTYSLFARNTVILPSHEFAAIDTGVSISIKSDNYVAVLGPDCDLSFKGISFLNAGDFITPAHADDEIKVALFNCTNDSITIEENSRIAKLVVVHTENVSVEVRGNEQVKRSAEL